MLLIDRLAMLKPQPYPGWEGNIRAEYGGKVDWWNILQIMEYSKPCSC
jgi:hypothetical protein